MTDATAQQRLPARVRAFAPGRPTAVAAVSIAVLAAAGWLYAGLLVAAALQTSPAAALGPGMALFDGLAGAGAPAWLQALCATPFAAGAGGGIPWSEAGPTFAMWTAMALAMMLPTAAPMLLSYAAAAEAPSAGVERPWSGLFVAAGYLAVWLAFGAAATALSIALRPAGAPSDAMLPVSRWLAALIFLGAGLYQFSPLKRACLAACRSPLLPAEPEPLPPGPAFAFGWRQGLDCLGCCAAVMAVMFAVGLMNVVWMAGLGVVLTVEKLTAGPVVPRALGAGLLALAALFALLSLRLI
jgi:predicted metal-binding membrane protein